MDAKVSIQGIMGKLTALAVSLILAYIGYNELFRGNRWSAIAVGEALVESKRVQKDLRYVVVELVGGGSMKIRRSYKRKKPVCPVHYWLF